MVEHGYGTRFLGFQNLMRHRIRNILLVCSLYDLYIFEEDGRLYELIRNEYQTLRLSHSPEITRVSNGKEALNILREENIFDLVITTQHVEDMPVTRLAETIREMKLEVPIILLAFDNRELVELISGRNVNLFERIFVWMGDFRIFLGILKYLEDHLNVDHDTRIVGVQSIILIEDDIKFYSKFLPVLYQEILYQSRNLISEGINLSHKYLRMRARPKILHCIDYEEAWNYYDKYEENILGIIADINFSYHHKLDTAAGIKFAKAVRKRNQDISILLQSNDPENEKAAKNLGCAFLLKDSPNMQQKLRQFTINHFGFGEFIFRTLELPDVGRATDLESLEEQIKIVPDESIVYHAERNHFSNWLKARTEFWLAHKLRPRKVTDFNSVAELRQDLLSSLREYRKFRKQGIIWEFKKESYDPETDLARIGGGSLGGKARGLSFVNILIHNYQIQNQFENIRIHVPPGVILGTDVFDDFLKENDLLDFAYGANDDAVITNKFLEAKRFPEEILADLAAFLDLVTVPLAVRSSSLLEDSQYHPFAGVYQTYMIANDHENPLIRLNELLNAIKRVYASAFYHNAKEYIKMTTYRIQDEKMAVIIQKLVGTKFDNRFYPTFSGVAKSYNYYPVAPQKSTDGIVSMALGLGKMVVEGGNAVKFSPKYPNHLLQFSSIKDTLRNNQTHFYALDFEEKREETFEVRDIRVKTYKTDVAEKDGALTYISSTYSAENNIITDGLSRQGARIITFAPILKYKTFSMPQILELLLEMGSWGMGTPVEIEFAVNLNVPKGQDKEFGFLQMRPLVINKELDVLKLEVKDKNTLLCESSCVLGHGITDSIYDIVYVDHQNFDRSKSKEVAREIHEFNEKLIRENKPYLLVGVGRWGTADPWLGIPVEWNQISGAKTIVETNFKNFMVTPSQGSHFFQNITTFMISYFTVNEFKDEGFFDWKWLTALPCEQKKQYTMHVRLEKPIIIKVNGQENKGIIIKPGV
ncbi:MAG: histidine kinase [Calditrichaceae bacterium]|nr:histidine kinase [Calditrichaceae bacterium]MBN2708561.1 histidine kinase [Calditrichaceae bacterium]